MLTHRVHPEHDAVEHKHTLVMIGKGQQKAAVLFAIFLDSQLWQHPLGKPYNTRKQQTRTACCILASAFAMCAVCCLRLTVLESTAAGTAAAGKAAVQENNTSESAVKHKS
jgi:hypothetical protein